MTTKTFTHRGMPACGSVSSVIVTRAPLQDRVSLSRRYVLIATSRMIDVVPKVWGETIEAHRREVSEAILDATAALATEFGVNAVSMSQIAERTGIGRATLYKYFPSVEAVLTTWHERHVRSHVMQLAAIADSGGPALDRLTAVMESYALIEHEHHGSELAAALHHGEHVGDARAHLTGFLERLIAGAVAGGDVRDDVAPAELATYCLHALNAASELRSKAAVRRLVALTLAGLRPVPPRHR